MRSSWKNRRIALLLLFFVTGLLCAEDSQTAGSGDGWFKEPGPLGWQTALPGYTFQFPRDYFNHPGYQTEWWYYTGNLRSSDGRRFGFELTFFRQGISHEASTQPWFVRDLWMAHLALSDITGQHFYHQERLNRAGPGIAGADASTGLVWNGNWQARIAPGGEQLRATGDSFALQLQLVPAKPPTMNGKNGVSQKAEGVGHASHYFSLTRLITSGSVDLDSKTYTVEGTSWMDHEFFSGSMAPNETGWDWLSVQLNDGSDLMLYRLRRKDGSIDPYSSGSYVDRSGKTTFLSLDDFTMKPATDSPAADVWTSPATKASYPVRWHVSIPRLKLGIDVTTPLRDQELTGNTGPSYWEGAIDVIGSRDAAPVRGVGYLEMTGYADPGKPILPDQ